MTTYNKMEDLTSIGMEPVKCQSGRWYSLSQNDIAVFVADTTEIFRSFISEGQVIGLFLDMDNAQFISLVLYQACILCGANVIRCGISDFQRQLPVKEEICLDWIISSDFVLKRIAECITYKRQIVIKRSEAGRFPVITENELYIYELYDIPGFIVFFNKDFFCPGYDVIDFGEETVLRKKGCVENEEITEISLGKMDRGRKLKKEEPEIVMDFIKLYVMKLVKEDLNGKVNDDNSIELSSIGQVELLVKIEEEFEISLEIENISIDKFEHVDLLTKLIFNTIMVNADE